MIQMVDVNLEDAVVDERHGKVRAGDGKGQEQVGDLLVFIGP